MGSKIELERYEPGRYGHNVTVDGKSRFRAWSGQEILMAVRDGSSVRIVDKNSGRDVSSVVLITEMAHFLPRNLEGCDRIPVNVLEAIIRAPAG